MKEREITGARVLLECLKRLGVKDIFGYPGGSVIPIYDEIYSFEGIKHYLSRHEQGAVHEADGYARASGEVGVCIATSGPGATNLVTGIMTVFMDSIPILAITGQVNRAMLGRDSFQETDIVNITLPITKSNYQIISIEEIPQIVKEAYHIAKSGRPGPVLIDFPRDIQLEKIEVERFEELYSEEMDLSGYERGYQENLSKLDEGIKLIENSKKPLIISGAGVIHSKGAEEFREFVERLQIPVTSTLLGLGAYPGDKNLFLGMLGMVRQWQELFHERRYSEVNLEINPDFVKVAEAYGVKSVTLESEEDLEKIDEILKNDEPILVNCIVKKEENVYPMIPAGKSVEDMIGLRGVKDYE